MPWTVSDVDRFKKGLTPAQKARWVAIANGALESCRKRGGENCEASAIRIANSQVGVHTTEGINLEQNMEVMLTINFIPDSAYTVDVREWDGRQYLVVPVTMMVEGVHNGSHGPIYHSAEELGKVVQAWNGIPVTISHPVVEGNYVSANSPEVLENWSVGRIFNARMDGEKLKADAWIDAERLQTISSSAYARIKAGEIMEVSVGVFSDEEPMEGEWNGETYTAVARNHRPDHLALLPDEVGACSVADGCGVRVNQQNSKMIRTKKNGGNDVTEVNKDLVSSLILQKLILQPIEPTGDMALNQEGYTERLHKIQRLLDSMDTPNVSHYLEEAYDDSVVYSKRGNPAGTEYYKQTYQSNPDGTISLTGDPVKVVKKVEYVTVQQENVKQNVKVMCEICKQKASELIAHEGTHFTEKDRAWLETLTEDKLDKLIPKLRVQTDSNEPSVEDAWKVVSNLSVEDLTSRIPDAVKTAIIAQAKEAEEKENLVQAILNREGNDFTDDDLATMSVTILKKLVKPEQVISYVAANGGMKLNAGKESGKVTPLLPPGV